MFCVTTVPFDIITFRFFSHLWLIIGFVTRVARRVPLEKKEMITLPENPRCLVVHVALSLVFWVVFCRPSIVLFLLVIVSSVLFWWSSCLSFFFWWSSCLSFFFWWSSCLSFIFWWSSCLSFFLLVIVLFVLFLLVIVLSVLFLLVISSVLFLLVIVLSVLFLLVIVLSVVFLLVIVLSAFFFWWSSCLSFWLPLWISSNFPHYISISQLFVDMCQMIFTM